jgi:hypothetical protein
VVFWHDLIIETFETQGKGRNEGIENRVRGRVIGKTEMARRFQLLFSSLPLCFKDFH